MPEAANSSSALYKAPSSELSWIWLAASLSDVTAGEEQGEAQDLASPSLKPHCSKEVCATRASALPTQCLALQQAAQEASPRTGDTLQAPGHCCCLQLWSAANTPQQVNFG